MKAGWAHLCALACSPVRTRARARLPWPQFSSQSKFMERYSGEDGAPPSVEQVQALRVSGGLVEQVQALRVSAGGRRGSAAGRARRPHPPHKENGADRAVALRVVALPCSPPPPQDVLQPVLLRRMKEDVETLPEKEEVVVWVELTAMQHQYYK